MLLLSPILLQFSAIFNFNLLNREPQLLRLQLISFIVESDIRNKITFITITFLPAQTKMRPTICYLAQF